MRLLLILSILAALALPAEAQRVVRADLALSPDGRVAATGTGTGTLLLWDAATWTLRRQHTADGSLVFGFDFTPDGRFVAFGTRSGGLYVLEVATGRVAFEVRDREGSVSATRFGSEGRLFAAGVGRTLTSYRWRTGEPLRSYDLGRDTMPDGAPLVVEDFEVLPEQGRLFIARFDGQARLMDVETGDLVHAWTNKPRPRDGARNVKNVAVLPDGRTGFFTGVGGEVVKVDLLTGARLDSVRVHPDFVSGLAHSPNGRLLAVTDLDGITTLLDTDRLSPVQRMEQEASFASRWLLFAVAFRPGTDEVVTGGIRLPLIVWDGATGERLRTIAELPDTP